VGEVSIDALTGEIPIDAEALSPVERERARADVAESDLVLAEDEIRTLRRSLAALKAKLNRETEETPAGKLSRLVARYYVQRMGKTAAWKFGDKRQKAVISRLKEDFAPLYICRAIDGLAIGFNTNVETGVKYDDLELCCRDEVNLERFHQVAIVNDAPTIISPEWEKLLNFEDSLTSTSDQPTTERGAE
jgi:hypothetical protein